MDPWLLMELDNLRNRLDRLGEDTGEIQQLRDEIKSIGNLSLGMGPRQAALFYSASKIKSKIEDLEGRIGYSNPFPYSEGEDETDEVDKWQDEDDLEEDDEVVDDEDEGEEEDDS